MTTLYGCKKTQDRETFLIAKFDENLVIERSYFVGPKTCQCQGWTKRGSCKHLMIRTLFMMNKHTEDGWFLDFETRIWREYPQLLEDGTIGEARTFHEKYDGLKIGDNGYCERSEAPSQSSIQSGASSASPVGAEGLAFPPPAPAPEVEQRGVPSGAPILSSQSPSSNLRPQEVAIVDGIKRRRGL